MNVASTISQVIGRLVIDKPSSHPYRGVLLSSANKAERRLFALLWAGIGLIILMTCLHMKTLFSDVALVTNLQPPPHMTINIGTEQAKSEIALKTNNNNSLFQLAKQDAPVSPPSADTENINQRPKKSVHRSRLWQIEIQRPAISETLVINEIANAARQLKSGDMRLAEQTLQALLTRDPHSVEAMEGMRVAVRQLGDAEGEQKYLDMLRLEIPDYDLDRDGAVIGGLD